MRNIFKVMGVLDNHIGILFLKGYQMMLSLIQVDLRWYGLRKIAEALFLKLCKEKRFMEPQDLDF